MSKRKSTSLIIAIVLFSLIFWYYLETIPQRLKAKYRDQNYSGIIKEIKRTQRHRGSPDINLDGNWVIVNLNDSKLFKHLSIGDSIVKLKGEEFTSLYRIDQTGRYVLLKIE
jgi:hypothetical protein